MLSKRIENRSEIARGRTHDVYRPTIGGTRANVAYESACGTSIVLTTIPVEKNRNVRICGNERDNAEGFSDTDVDKHNKGVQSVPQTISVTRLARQSYCGSQVRIGM
jgi:hypothetical protein